MNQQASVHGSAVAEHGIWESLTSLLEASEATSESEEPDGEHWRQRHQWTEYVLDHIRTRIQQADPQLVSISGLDGMRKSAVGAEEQLNNFASNGQTTHLDAAAKHVDALLSAAGGLPSLPPSEQAATTARAVERLSDLIEKTAATGQAQIDALREQGEQVAKAHADELAQRDKRLEEAGQAHEAAIEKRESQLAKLDEHLEGVRSELAATTSRLEAAEQEERDRWTTRANRVLEEIQELRKQASNLVTAKGAEIVAGGYMDYAEAQRTHADRWRLASVGFALAAVAFLVYVFFTTGDEGSVAAAVRAGLAAAALLGIAGYAGRQSAIHRRREQRAYKAGLEATAIEPFIANLPDSEKGRARRVFAEHFFSQPVDDPDPDAADEPVTASQLLSLLRASIERQ